MNNMKMRWGVSKNMHGNDAWIKELVLTFIATTLSIVLTFGTAAWFEKRQKDETRRLTAMMVISNIGYFVQNMHNLDNTLVEWQTTLTRISSMPRDSVLMLSEEEAQSFYNALAQGALLSRDKTAETIFSSSMSTWRDIGNLRFIEHVGECYSFINDIENNYRVQLERRGEISQRMLDSFDYENMTDGELVADVLDMKGVKAYITDFTQGFFLENPFALIRN